MPDVAERPVVQGRRAPDVLELVAHPALALVAVFLVEEPAVALQGFIRAHAEQTDRLLIPVGDAVPAAELLGQVLLVHPVAIGGHGVVLEVDDVLVLGHGAHPGLLLGVVPRVPIHLIAAQRRARGHGQADPVRFDLVLDALKGALNELGRHRVLRLKVLVEDADLLFRVVFPPKVQREVEQQADVLSAGKGDVNVVELLKDQAEPLLRRLVNIARHVLSLHGIPLRRWNFFPSFSSIPHLSCHDNSPRREIRPCAGL